MTKNIQIGVLRNMIKTGHFLMQNIVKNRQNLTKNLKYLYFRLFNCLGIYNSKLLSQFQTQ